jgi:hypothetical protein
MTCTGWGYPDSLTDPYHRWTILQAWWRTADNSMHRQALLRMSGTAVQAFVYNGAAQFGGNVNLTATTGSWQHFAMTYDGSTLIGYRNGVAGGTTYSPNGNIATDTNNLALGRQGALYNNGNVADRGIWNRALSANEIADMYNKKLECGFFPNGLIQWWRLDVKGDNFPVSTALCQDGDYGLIDRFGTLPATVGGGTPIFDIARDIPLVPA